MKTVFRIMLVIFSTLTANNEAMAWGSLGHRVIAGLAEQQLTPNATEKVREILANGAVDSGSCVLITLEDAAVWPDCVRGRHLAAYRGLTTLHYEDRPLCGSGSRDIYCKDGMCVTSAIQSALASLRSPTTPAAEKSIALAEVVHFVGDLHQPLHLTDNNDRGGNEVPAYFPNHRARTNLHAVWDSDLVKSSIGYKGQRADMLLGMMRSHPEWSGGTIESWASETHALAVSVTYGKLPQRLQCLAPNPTLEVLDQSYVDMSDAVVETQLAKAGTRLAKLLNTTLK